MKKLFIRVGFGILLVLVSLFALYLSGPRMRVDTTIQRIDLPGDLDTYLADQEAGFTDIVPGTEKTIIWARKANTRTPLSIVYLHGFSASRQETAPLCDQLATDLGANLFYTRFTGHGRPGTAMAKASVNDWLNDSVEALEIGKRLGDRVIVVGTSNGATLATWLAQQPVNDKVLAYILISPNYGLSDSRAEIMAGPWGKQIVKLLVGEEYTTQPESEAHAQFWTCRYPSSALVTMMALVKEVRQGDFSRISTPVLVIYSPHDNVVDPERIEQAFPQFASANKQIVPIERIVNNGNHVLAGDIRAPDNTTHVAEITLRFIHLVE